MNPHSLRIVTALDPRQRTSAFDSMAVQDILMHLLPKDFFNQTGAAALFLKQLPLIGHHPLEEPPFDLTFFLCCRFRENAFRFFCEMIRQWLLPKRQTNILLQFAVDFLLPDLTDQQFIAAKLSLRCQTAHEKEIIARHLPALLTELRLGVASSYHASCILEVRGLSYDEQTMLIQERIALLIKSRPQDFDYDLINQMQQFFVLCKEEFKQTHSVRQMSRMICIQYLFRKALKLSFDAFPDRRYSSVKLARIELRGGRKVLGIIIGLSFLRENECFEARHILGAVRTLIPGAQKVEGSFYAHTQHDDSTYTAYLEIERAGESFTCEEMFLLKHELPSALKGRIEQRLHSVFMPQNEETIMRHIVTLSGELQYVRDLPQVMIDFVGQTQEHLEFLVIVLRILRANQLSIQRAFESQATPLEFLFDRRKFVGTVRHKYKKEATLFRLRQNKLPFLRQDHSVDLYKARQHISSELTRMIGEFRDYNGGTIFKETELLTALRQALGHVADENHFLLENFFFSLHPVVMRSLLSAEVLARLFHMIIDAQVEGVPEEQSYQIRIKEDGVNFYFLAIADDPSFAESLLECAEAYDAATCLMVELEYPCFGLICTHHDPGQARELWYLLEKTLATWSSKKNSFISL